VKWNEDSSTINPRASVTMSGPKIFTVVYKTQYLLTIQTSGLSSSYPTKVYLGGSQVGTAYDGSSFTQWFDASSSTGAIGVDGTVSGTTGTRCVFVKWNEDSSTINPRASVTMSGPKIFTVVYKTQYQVTFDQAGVGLDFTGTVATVEGLNYTVASLPTTPPFWWDSGSTHDFSFASPLVVNSKQYVWSSTFGLSTLKNGTLPITASGNVVGNYMVQNQIVFDQVGVNSDFTGTVLIVDTVNYAQLPISFSWSVGSTHSFAFQSPLVVGTGAKQYVWTSTTGLLTLQNGSITVTTYGGIIGNYKTQYCLTVTSAHDSPSPAVGASWYDAGALVTASVSSPADQSGGTQYRCIGWTGSGSVASGSGVTTTFTINAVSSITWNWQTQYYLMVSSPYGTVGGQSWYDSGATAYATLDMGSIDHGNGTSHLFTNWNVDALGTSYVQSDPISMNGPKTALAIWKTQYNVTLTHTGLDISASGTVVIVNSSSISFGQLPYNIWVDSGSSVTYSYNNVSSSTAGKQFVLIGVTGLPSPVTVTSPLLVTGNYKTQYQVTFNQTGVGSDFTGTVVNVDLSGYTITSLPVPFWWDNGSSHTFSFSSPLVVDISKQYNWISTLGLTTLQSGTLTVTGSGSVTGNYVVENKLQITFSQTGVTPDFTGTVVTIDGSNFNVTALSSSFWWDVNSVHTFAYQSPLVVNPNAKQYIWFGTTGLSTLQSGNTTATTSGSIIGNYKTQYCLSLATSPPSVTTPSGAGWYDAGTNATISTTAFVEIVPGSSRYRFNGWTAADMTEIQDLTRSPTTVSMDQGKTVTASYVVQYNLTFNQVGVGSDFSDTIVMVDGINYTASGLPVSFMWDNGSIHTFSFVSPLSASKQYAWMFTSGLSTSQADSITVSASGNVAGNYAVTYALTITATTGGATNPAVGVHVYPSGSTVQVTALPNTNYQFDHWELDSVNVGAGNPYSVLISTDHTLNAVFKPVPPALSVSINPLSGMIQIGQPLTFNSIISGGAPPYSYQWYLDGTSFTGATSSSWTWTPQHASLHFVYVKVTDSNGATAQSELATITVTSTPVPVGGYSISFARPSVLVSIVAYVAVAALSAAVLSARKRKRK
jgi:hypothetical protein